MGPKPLLLWPLYYPRHLVLQRLGQHAALWAEKAEGRALIYPKTQNGPKALYKMIFRPKSLKI